ncbi:MAG: 4Fe-4S binding protein [Bradymonadaceae bacterium]|nr:4Fe-4S binding protein [Lujinxingiaceae bacterium]
MKYTSHTAPFALLVAILLVAASFAALPAAHAQLAQAQVDNVHVIEWICPMQCDGLRFSQPGDCPVCNMAIVAHRVRRAPAPDSPDALMFEQLDEGGFFEAAFLLDNEEIVEQPARALMPGVPNALFYGASGVVVLITFLLLVLLGEPRRNIKKTSERWKYPRFELTRFKPFDRLVKWRGFQPMLQAPVVLVFVLVIAAGLFGNQDASQNIAPVLTWNIWWMGLIFFAFFAGEVWCTVCPWMAIPDWIGRLSRKLRGPQHSRGPGRRWPTALKNLYPAIGLFIALTWVELAYDAPYRPALTALLGLAMVAMAAGTLFVFERKGFCRYVCPIGRVTGAYGTTGMLEIRRREAGVCKSCTTHDCLHGNERGLPCPTSEFMGAMNENSYCTMCTECLKSCPHDNIAINVRVPLADLMGPHRRRHDEAWLLLIIFVVTIFHGLAMIPLWTHHTIAPLREQLVVWLGFDMGYLAVFSLAMSVFFAASIAAYALACQAMRLASGNAFYRFRDFFTAFAYPLLPVALAYHLAHNSLHFFYEGSKLVRLVSDPFGRGWDLFGTAQNALTMLVPIQYLWIAQLALVIAGNLAAVWLVNRASHRMFGNRHQALRAAIAMIIFVAALSIAALWLLSQPMEMRTA